MPAHAGMTQTWPTSGSPTSPLGDGLHLGGGARGLDLGLTRKLLADHLPRLLLVGRPQLLAPHPVTSIKLDQQSPVLAANSFDCRHGSHTGLGRRGHDEDQF